MSNDVGTDTKLNSNGPDGYGFSVPSRNTKIYWAIPCHYWTMTSQYNMAYSVYSEIFKCFNNFFVICSAFLPFYFLKYKKQTFDFNHSISRIKLSIKYGDGLWLHVSNLNIMAQDQN